MVIDTAKRYTATMVTSHGTMVIALDPAVGAQDGQQLRFPVPPPTTTTGSSSTVLSWFSRSRAATPPAPVPVVPGYKFADELSGSRALPDRLVGHGQRRPQHQRKPVLREKRALRRGACLRSMRTLGP